MLDHLKTERYDTTAAQTRLRTYMAGLLVLGAVVVGLYQCPRRQRTEEGAAAQEAPAGPSVTVDVARLPASDDAAVHSRYDAEALAYLLDLAQQNPGGDVRYVTVAQLASLPPAEARGGIFVAEGTVSEVLSVEHGDRSQLLWTLVLEGEGGERALVLKHGLATDTEGGRPEDAHPGSTEYVQVGDLLLVRGIYLQRRTGTFGTALLREPAPVLVATPPRYAFRKTLPPADPIEDLSEAGWDVVRDRYMRETRRWDEPALFEVLQWARRQGHERILEDIRTGALPSAPWDQSTFLTWSREVDLESPDAPRPFTEEARGRLFRTSGLLEAYVKEGWRSLPRNRWRVDSLYVLNLISDHYGNAPLKPISPFPLETFAGVTVRPGTHQHVTIYGLFLKNFSFETRRPSPEGGALPVTVPLFIALHVEPVPERESPYKALVWGISIAIVVLGLLFYLVLVRGESKEAARMERRRRDRRRRGRAKDVPPPAGPDPGAGDADAGPSGEAPPEAG